MGAHGIKSPCFLWLPPHLDNLVLGWAEEEPTGYAELLFAYILLDYQFSLEENAQLSYQNFRRIKALSERFGRSLIASAYICDT